MTGLPSIPKRQTMLKKMISIFAAAALLGACSAMPAGGGSASGAAGATVAAEKLRLAMVNPDRAALEALVSEDLSYGHSGGKIDTRTSFIADLLSGASDFVSIDIADQTVKQVQGVVLVRHTLSAATNDSGKPGTVTLKVLQVWQEQGGQWKLLARQAVRPA
jgi:hypothetical protein